MSAPLLIDISRLLYRAWQGKLHTGVDRVCIEYIHRYGQEARAAIFFFHRLWIFPSFASKRLFDLVLNPGTNFSLRLFFLVFCWGGATWFPRNLKNAILLNLGHSNLERSSYLRALRRRALRLVCFIHDLIPLTHPESCRANKPCVHFKRISKALPAASGVIVNSKATLREVMHFAATHHLPLPPAVAALLAPAPLPPPDSGRPLKDPYFVMVGTIEPRKNYAFLLQLWRQMAKAQNQSPIPHLVLIGQRGWSFGNVTDLLEHCSALQGLVHEISACSDRALATYLHHSQALLFPSFEEGFGMPIAEALGGGVPVIASNLPVFREFAGDIPEYIAPLDGLRWMEVIQNYATPSSPMRTAQLARATRFQPPTWKAHFQAVDVLLEPLRKKNTPAIRPAFLPVAGVSFKTTSTPYIPETSITGFQKTFEKSSHLSTP